MSTDDRENLRLPNCYEITFLEDHKWHQFFAEGVFAKSKEDPKKLFVKCSNVLLPDRRDLCFCVDLLTTTTTDVIAASGDFESNLTKSMGKETLPQSHPMAAAFLKTPASIGEHQSLSPIEHFRSELPLAKPYSPALNQVEEIAEGTSQGSENIETEQQRVGLDEEPQGQENSETGKRLEEAVEKPPPRGPFNSETGQQKEEVVEQPQLPVNSETRKRMEEIVLIQLEERSKIKRRQTNSCATLRGDKLKFVPESKKRRVAPAKSLNFSVNKIGQQLKDGGYTGNRCGAGAKTMLTAVLNAVTGDLLAIAGDRTKNNNRDIIEPCHISEAVRKDPDFRRLLCNVDFL